MRSATADFNVYYGRGRDHYDVRGRTAHESLFNPANGSYRGPSSQQGYSPFTTWTRGLAWAMLGFAEQLEFIATLDDAELAPLGSRGAIEGWMLEAARATSDYYIEIRGRRWRAVLGCRGARPQRRSATGEAGPADPFNDSSRWTAPPPPSPRRGCCGWRAGSTATWRGWPTLRAGRADGRSTRCSIASGPYLSSDPAHEGLLLHSVYHWPNGWDHVPEGSKIPRGESSQWGDYHAARPRSTSSGSPGTSRT